MGSKRHRVCIVRSLVVGLGLFGAAGCSDDSKEEDENSAAAAVGVYATTAHTESQPCDGASTPLALDPPYFELSSDGYFVDVYPCTGPDAASCDPDGFPLVFAAEEAGNGVFRTEETSRSGTDDSCYVEYYGYEIRTSENSVTINSDFHSGDWTGSDCAGDFISDAQVAKARMLPCDTRETWTGTKQ